MTAIIIDDERQSRDALASLLQTYCHNTHLVGQAESGESGIELIRRLRPDLVFLDVEMPDMDGFEVLRRFDRVDFALVFITAYNRYAIESDMGTGITVGTRTRSYTTGLSLQAGNLRSSQPGMLVWSRWQNGMPHLSLTGLVCIARPFRRTPMSSSGGSASGLDCTGSHEFLFDASFFLAAGLSAGDSVCAQFWTQDGPGSDGRTEGFTFVIAP